MYTNLLQVLEMLDSKKKCVRKIHSDLKMLSHDWKKIENLLLFSEFLLVGKKTQNAEDIILEPLPETGRVPLSFPIRDGGVLPQEKKLERKCSPSWKMIQFNWKQRHRIFKLRMFIFFPLQKHLRVSFGKDFFKRIRQINTFWLSITQSRRKKIYNLFLPGDFFLNPLAGKIKPKIRLE